MIRRIVVIALMLGFGLGGYVWWAWNRPLHPGAELILVKPGTSLRSFARDLSARRIVAEPYSLVALGYAKSQSRGLKSGEYRFRDGLTLRELLDQVVSGRVVEYPLVLLEGWNFEQVLRTVASAPKLTATLTGRSEREIMAQLGHPELPAEGRFYPDTYYYSAGTTDIAILARAFEQMRTRLSLAWEDRAPNLPYRTPEQALTLASIVEKETGRADERPLIAGVFVNRLRKGMRLQSDPTVIYGMGARFQGNVRLKDLRRDTPYNTYTRSGLPPTPIAMPGSEALAAAVRPAETDSLYFVARGDGSHVFSATLKEHNAAVVKFQLGGKPRPFSSFDRSRGVAKRNTQP